MEKIKSFLMMFVLMFSFSANAMDDLLIYYGWLNSYNSATNSFNNDNVVASIGSNYEKVVLGAGLANPIHPDYSNTQYIISNLKANYPAIEIFGYVQVDQPLNDFQSQASQWDTLVVDGIFFDNAGYDFGNTRQDQNDRILFVKQLNFATKVFMNSWNINHVLGTVDDPAYPNTLYNPTADESLMDANDWYLLESFVYNWSVPGYWSLEHELDRVDRSRLVKASYPVNLAAIAIIDQNDVNAQLHFDRLYKFSHLSKLEAVGSADNAYGASTATTAWYVRPSVSHL
jgi:hypothetical protein